MKQLSRLIPILIFLSLKFSLVTYAQFVNVNGINVSVGQNLHVTIGGDAVNTGNISN
jgi:hypothetical protein